MKRSDSRCTPKKFREIYDDLSPEKKLLIGKIGLGAFQYLPKEYINHKILNELVRSYDLLSNKITTSVGEFVIKSEKVGYAFGLNHKGDPFEKTTKEFEHKLNEEEKEALSLFKGQTLTVVQDM
ncbi:hypothetical protein PIB30_046853, partial [Stylosanthes scabra]|nr:hypothetical protein [Stylosanthes scabra]